MLENKKLFLLDIDGTIKRDSLFEGVKEFLDNILASGGEYIFITNNPNKSLSEQVKLFSFLGLKVSEENFISALSMSTNYLLEHFRDDKISVIGSLGMKEEFRRCGLNITEEVQEDVKVVFIGDDDQLDFSKLKRACELLQRDEGIEFLASNSDIFYNDGGVNVPDCGSIANMLGRVCGREAKFLGKPSEEFVKEALRRTGFQKDETLVVGDLIDVDIACAKAAGVDGCLVLSGDTSIEDVERLEDKPKYIFQDIKMLNREIFHG